MSHKFFDLTFTDSVKTAQEKYGSRRNYARFEHGDPDFDGLGDAELDFIESRDGFYIATVNGEGQPYIQFRGGPRGFLRQIDDRTLGFADFRGNLQYISVGNLTENPKAALFLMDYATQTRLKILATVEVRDVRKDPELAAKFEVKDYKAKIERVMLLHVEAFDWNCPQHITPRYTMDEIRAMTAPMTAEIERLEREVEHLKAENGEKR